MKIFKNIEKIISLLCFLHEEIMYLIYISLRQSGWEDEEARKHVDWWNEGFNKIYKM